MQNTQAEFALDSLHCLRAVSIQLSQDSFIRLKFKKQTKRCYTIKTGGGQ